MGAFELPSDGEPLSMNVLIVIFAGPACWTVGAGSITSSDSFEILSNPTNATIKAIDAIAAPIPREGPCINYFSKIFGYI